MNASVRTTRNVTAFYIAAGCAGVSVSVLALPPSRGVVGAWPAEFDARANPPLVSVATQSGEKKPQQTDNESLALIPLTTLPIAGRSLNKLPPHAIHSCFGDG